MNLQSLLGYWWILLIILPILFYSVILRVLFGMIRVPEDKIGLVTKKFNLVGNAKSLGDGKIIAMNGEAGYQVTTLPPNLHWGYFPWQYRVEYQPFTIIPKDKIGLVSAKDGKSTSW